MEHTGLIMTPAVDYIVTHELAHEWWYALISNDQAEAPWLDESFASYAEEAAGAQQHALVPRAGRRRRPRDARRRRTSAAAAATDYGIVYYEGACLLDVLRDRMGADRSTPALRDYAIANRYGWSTAAKFRAAMDAASPVPLGDALAPLPRSPDRVSAAARCVCPPALSIQISRPSTASPVAPNVSSAVDAAGVPLSSASAVSRSCCAAVTV